MSSLTPKAEWADVYQLEKHDKVIGGKDGVSNRQATSLTARTEFLRTAIQRQGGIGACLTLHADDGKDNAVHLPYVMLEEQTFSAFDGMAVLFTPKYENTGATTLSLAKDTPLPVQYNSAELVAGFLQVGGRYLAIYSEADKAFHIEVMGVSSWDALSGKPKTFAPSDHSHAWNSITGKPSKFPASDHNHAWGSITGKPSKFPASDHNHAWGSITGKPSKFPASDHNHAWGSITGKPLKFPPADHNHDARYYQKGQVDQMVIPVGSIIAWPLDDAPDGYLECDGATISRSSFSELFSVIGSQYGSGDGSTTFTLPDYRGEFLRGWDSGRGIDVGRSLGSDQADGIGNHVHQLPISYRHGSNWDWEPWGVAVNASGKVKVNNGHSRWTRGFSGKETRPRNVSVMFCIKY